MPEEAEAVTAKVQTVTAESRNAAAVLIIFLIPIINFYFLPVSNNYTLILLHNFNMISMLILLQDKGGRIWNLLKEVINLMTEKIIMK